MAVDSDMTDRAVLAANGFRPELVMPLDPVFRRRARRLRRKVERRLR